MAFTIKSQNISVQPNIVIQPAPLKSVEQTIQVQPQVSFADQSAVTETLQQIVMPDKTPVQKKIDDIAKTIISADVLAPIIIDNLSGLLTDINTVKEDPRKRNNTDFSQKSNSYGDNLGIDNKRPEIISITKFNPLYNENFNELLSYEILSLNELIYNTRSEKYRAILEKAKLDFEIANYLELLKNNFALFISNSSNYISAIDSVNKSAVQVRRALQKGYKPQTAPLQQPQKSLSDALGVVGYLSPQTFSNTKSYLQLCIELANLLQMKYTDVCKEKNTARFSSNDLFTLEKFKTNASIKNLYRQSIKEDDGFFSDLTFLQNESKISALFSQFDDIFDANKILESTAIFLSNESSISKSIVKKDVQSTISKYNYQIDKEFSNFDLFDNLVSYVGDNIYENVKSINNNSLSSITQYADTSSIVMSLEDDILINAASQYRPGFEFFVDEATVVKNGTFSSDNTKKFLSNLNSASELASTVSSFTTTQNNISLFVKKLDTTSPKALYNEVVNSFFVFGKSLLSFSNSITKSQETQSSLVVEIMAKCSTNKKLLSLFCHYFYAYSKAARSDYFLNIVDEIIKEAYPFSPLGGRKSNIEDNFSFKKEEVRNELTQGSSFIDKIISVFNSQYSNLFYAATFDNEKTAFSTLKTSAIKLFVFRFIVLSIAGLIDDNTASNENGTSIKLPVNINYSYSKYTDTVTQLEKYTSTLTSIVESITTYITEVKKAVSSFISVLESKESKEFIDFSSKIMSEDELSYLFITQQSNIISTFFEKLKYDYSKKNDFSSQFYIDNSFDQTSNLKSYFKNSKYLEGESFNSKILSVGIPVGLKSSIIEKSTSKSDSYDYQNDVVAINVYKVDVRNPSIIFKPSKKIYELSRFSYEENGIDISSTDKIRSNFRTIDYSYFDSKTVPTSFAESSLSRDEYSFLTDQQKFEIYQNTLESTMLQKYLKNCCGLEISELTFYQDDSNSFLKMLDQNVIDELLKKSVDESVKSSNITSALSKFSISNVSKIVRVNSENSISNLLTSVQNITQYQKDIQKSIVELSKIPTIYSDISQLAKKIFKSRTFDRIFHILIDTDEFEIDVEKTNSSEDGKNCLLNLKKIEEIYEKDGKLYMKKQTRQDNVFSLERYFVDIQTMIGEQ